MRTPFLYRVTRWVLRVALGCYFRRVEVSGRRHVPAAGPLILASNHPHSITDALVLGLGAGRMLHYLAHSGLFRNRWKAAFLRSSGVIPVYRRHDVKGAAERNVEMFGACHEVMEKGGAIGIFPEGTSEDERRVQKLKTGTARIALQSEEKNGWRLGVVIVPVGLNFESRQRFRTRVLLRFGEPIVAADYREAYESDPFEAVSELTSVLHDAIRRGVVNIDHTEFAELVQDVEMVYKGELLARAGLVIPGRSKFKRDQTVSREIARARDYFFERSPDVIWRVGKLLKEYRRKLERLHLRDEMLRKEKGPSVTGATTKFVALGTLGLPIAVYGAMWNYIPYKLIGWLALRLAPNVAKVHYVQLTMGALVFLLYYGPLLYLVYRALGPVGAAVFAVTVPPAGLFARAFARRMVWRRGMIRFAYLDLAHGYHVQKLRHQRQRLIDELDAALEEYLRAATAERNRGANLSGREPAT